MATFYKGYKTKNLILENYFKGKYVNNKGLVEKLDNKINKYNLEFIRRINELNKLWYGTIIADRLGIELLSKHKDNNYLDINNLWRLLKAQSATIRYNTLLRKALKTYALNKQKIYDEVKIDLDMQDERIVRNRKLIIDLFKDYGLADIINLIEKENDTDLISHIVYFTDNAGKDLLKASTFETDDEVIEYYNEIVKTYIEYIEKLANKYDIQIYENISEYLKRNRQYTNERIAQNKKEIAEKRQVKKENNIKEYIKIDNVALQNDIDANNEIINRRFGSNEARISVIEKIKILGGKAYYICKCDKSKVFYISNSGALTTAINKAKLFKTIDEAQCYINTIRDKVEAVVFSIESLVCSDNYKIDPNKVLLAPNIKTIEEQISAKSLTDGEKRLVSTLLRNYCNGLSTEVDLVVIYAYCSNTNSPNFGKSGFWAHDKTKGYLASHYINIEYINAKDPCINSITTSIRENLKKYGYESQLYKIKLGSNWQKYLINVMDAEHEFIIGILNGERSTTEYWDKKLKEKALLETYRDEMMQYFSEESFSRDSIIKMHQILNDKRQQGLKVVYYINAIKGRTYKLRVGNKHLTKGIQKATLFNSYEEALEHLAEALVEGQIAKVYEITL